MVQQGQIDHLLQESGEIQPPPAVVEQVYLKDFDAEYRRSIEDPEGFWSQVASELHWFKPWSQVFQWDYPNFQWLLDATCNITYNCLDRPLTDGRKNKGALVCRGEDGTARVVH